MHALSNRNGIRWLVVLGLALFGSALAQEAPPPDSFEPDGDVATATVLPLGESREATIAPVGDRDFWRIAVPGRGLLRVVLDPLPADLTPVVVLLDDAGQELTRVQGPFPRRIECLFEVVEARELVAMVCEGPFSPGENGYGHQWDNLASAEPYGIAAVFTPAPDPREPNGDLAAASAIRLDEEVTCTVFPRGDFDFFAVELPEGTRGTLAIEASAPDPVALQVQLYDPAGAGAAARETGAGGHAVLRHPVTAGGKWVFSLRDGPRGRGESGYGHQWDTASATAPAKVRATLLPAADPREPNEGADAASVLEPGKEVTGTLFPTGDIDVFSVEVPPGAAILSVTCEGLPPHLAPCLTLANPDQNEVRRLYGAPGAPIEFVDAIDRPGTWFLVLQDGPFGPGEAGYGHQWRNQASERSYRLRADLIPVLDANEPNDTAESARDLALATPVEGRIFPVGDHDFYRVRIPPPGRGRIEMDVTDVPDAVDVYLRLYGTDGNQIADRDAGGAGRDVRLVKTVTAPGDYVVLVHDGPRGLGETGQSWQFNNRGAPSPYRLTARFVTAGEGAEPNDEPATATPFAKSPDGSFTAEGAIFPESDHDWYSADLEPGEYEVVARDVPAPVAPSLQVHRKDIGQVVHVTGPPRGSGAEIRTRFTVAEAGTYYVLLHDGPNGRGEQGQSWLYNNRAARGTCHLTLRPAPGEPPPAPAGEPPPGEASPTAARVGAIRLDLATGEASSPCPLLAPAPECWFEFELPAPGRLRADVRDVPGLLDPRIELRAETGEEPLAVADGFAGDLGADERLQADLRPGKYFLRIVDADPAAAGAGGVARLEVRFAPVVSSEPNDTREGAKPLPRSGPVEETTFPSGDEDWFVFTTEKPGDLELRLDGVDPVLHPLVEVIRDHEKTLRALYIRGGRTDYDLPDRFRTGVSWERTDAAGLVPPGRRHHLGNEEVKGWPALEGVKLAWTTTFAGAPRGVTLWLGVLDLQFPIIVRVNGEEAGRLEPKGPLPPMEIPDGLLRAGENTIEVEVTAAPDGNLDDVLVELPGLLGTAADGSPLFVDLEPFVPTLRKKALEGYDVVVLDGLTDLAAFDLDRAETQSEVLAYVEGGGRFVLLCPQAAEGFGEVASRLGGALVAAPTSYDNSGLNARNVINGRHERGWASATNAPFPHEFVLATRAGATRLVDTVILWTEAHVPARRPREVEVSVSTEGPDAGFTVVARATIETDDVAQEIRFPPVRTRFVKVTLLGNHGDPNHTELGEIEVHGPGSVRGLFGLRHTPAWTDEEVFVVAPDDPVASGFARGSWNGYAASDQNSSFENAEAAGFRIVASPASDRTRAITAVRPVGKGLLVADTQEVGYPANRAADWRIGNLLGFPELLRLSRRGTMVPVSADPRGRPERLVASLPAPGRYYVRVSDPEGASAIVPWRLTAALREGTDPGEPDDAASTARTALPDRPARAAIGTPGDRDWFRVPVAEPSRLTLTVRGLGGDFDPSVRVYTSGDLVKPLLALDDSEGGGRGYGERCTVDVVAGTIFVEVRDADPAVADGDPYEVLALLEPLSTSRPFAWCDAPERAAALLPDMPVPFCLDPPGTRVLFEISPEQGFEVDVRVRNVPQSANPVVDVLCSGTPDGRPAPPLRILHLTGRSDFRLDDVWPTTLRWTRVEATAPEARTIVDRFGEFDVVILDTPRSLADFGLGESGFVEKVSRYAESGGTFALFSPELSLSEIAASRGGSAVRATSEFSSAWVGAKLIDGVAARANDGHCGWCSASGQVTDQEIVFTVGGEDPRPLDRLVVYNHAQAEGRRVKDFEVSLSLSADGPFDAVVSGSLEQRDGPQLFTFPAREARFVRFLAKNNYGDPTEVQLGEVEVYGPGSPSLFGLSLRRVNSYTAADVRDPAHPLAGGVLPATPERLARLPATAAFTGGAEAGFVSVLTLPGTPEAALMAVKEVGRGRVVVQSTHAGYPAHRPATLWLLANLLGRGDPLVGSFDGTCGGTTGGAEAFRFIADRPGPYWLAVSERSPLGASGRLTLSARYRPASGNWSPAAVAAVVPADGSPGIAPSSPLRLRLTRPVAGPSARIEVSGSTSGPVPVRLSLEEESRTLLVTPERPFAPGETVSACYTGGLSDDLGREVAGPLAWSFGVAGASTASGAAITVEVSSHAIGPRLVAVKVRSSMPLPAPPRAFLAPAAGGSRIPIALRETGAGEWAGEAAAPAGAADGPATIAVEAVAADGSPVLEVRAPLLRIDLTPPAKPKAPVLGAGPRGRVDASFPATAAADDVVRVLLLREMPGAQPLEAASLAGPGPGTLSDRSPGTGTFRYRLAAEDGAGNRSEPSEPSEIELFGAGLAQAVTGVTAQPKDRGVLISWSASGEAGVDGYSIYRRSDVKPFDPFAVNALAHLEPGRTSLADRPRDGRYFYYVTARDRRGNPSPLSEPAEVLLDTAPPTAQVDLTPWRRVPGPVDLELRVSEALAEPPTLTLAIPGRDPLPVELAPAGENVFRGRVELPADAPDGEARFAFVGVDPSKNRGEWIVSSATLYVDQAPPVADIYLDPDQPLRGGTAPKVVLILHEEVAQAPRLTIAANGIPPEVTLAATGDKRRFEGTLVVPEGVPDGIARFSLSAKDAFGHEGGKIRRLVEVTVGDGPPRPLYESTDPPAGILTMEEGARPLRVSLALTRSCSAVSLRLRTADGREHEVSLEGSGDRWRGVLELPETAPDGPATFLLSATDLTGGTGTRLTRGEMLLLNRKAPAPPADVTARSAAGGRVALAWRPPPSAGPLPVPVAGYRVRRGGETVAELVAALDFEDLPPEDGEHVYSVAAVSLLGVEGTFSPPVPARSDREPPGPMERPSAAPAERGTAVRVDFAPRPDASSFRVFRAVDGAEAAPAGDLPAPPFLDRSPGGKLRYAVAALDAAGNLGPVSEAVEIDFESALPVGTVSFEPAGPLTSAGGTARLSVSHALSDPPLLALVGRDGAEVPIELTGEAKEWTGALADLASLPGGKAKVRFLGRAVLEGAPVESQLLKGSTEIDVDARGPAVSVAFPEGTPRKGDRWFLRAGRYPLVLSADEPLAGPPRALFFASGRTEGLPLTLAPATGGAFETTLAVDGDTGEGAGVIEIVAADALGNEAKSTVVAFVRTKPPPVLPAVRIASLAHGRVFAAWNPPDDPGARRFEVFRTADPEKVQERPAFVVDNALGVEDRPGGGEWHYAVRAVDEAGNPGPRSAFTAVTVDLSPPAPPRDLEGEVLKAGTVRLRWRPAEGEAAAFYNIYYAVGEVRDPAQARLMNGMYPFTEIYGAPPEDGTFTFFITAVDAKLNESPPSQGVLLTMTDHPPVATVRLFDEEGARVNRVRAAAYRVEVTADQGLSEPPMLTVTYLEAAEPVTIELAPDGAVWRGRLAVPEDTPDGAAYFAWLGRDEQGNEGREILEGEYFEVDRSPPLAVREAAAATDTTDRLGAIDVSWKVPEAEIPHFYRVWRRAEPDGEVVPVTTLRVERVTERYSIKDVPPSDGAFEYRVAAVDLAGNVGPPSDWLAAESKTRVPKASILVRTIFSAGRPVAAIGLGEAEVTLSASAPLAGPPKLAIAIGGVEIPVAVAPSGDDDGITFTGRFTVTAATPEGEALFRYEGTDREGRTGSFVASGAALRIDRTAAEAIVTIDDLFTLRPNRYTGKLEKVPARAGDRRVGLTATKLLSAVPVLEAAPEGSEEWLRVRLAGDVPGVEFAGVLRIPAAGPEGPWRFRFRGTDLMGNEATRIAEPVRSFRLEECDNPMEAPRILETFETTGETFVVDVAAPETPDLLNVEHLKLGVFSLTYAPKGEPPITYDLYRALTPIVTTEGLTPIRKEIRAEVIVDDPPCDGRWFWSVTALDAAGNESPPSASLSAVVDSIKPELKIKPVPSEDFVIIDIESDEPMISLYLNFPGGPRQAVLGGDSGELVVEQDPDTGIYHHRVKLKPQQLEVFNGKVEIVVHSPDPAGNIVEQTAEMSISPLNPATGAVVESVDQQAALVIPPGVEPVIPSQPGRQVRGRGDLVFLRYEHIPRDPRAPKEDPKAPDPLPLELEMISRPYRVELNRDTEEPMELKASASQASMPELPKIVFSVGDLADFGDQYTDPEFMKQRVKVVRWTPPEPDSGKKGRWEAVPEILIDLENWKVIAPADKVTSYVVVAETTPPSVREMEPAPDAVVCALRPNIAARIVDKGTGVAVGPENRISLKLDGEVVAAVIDDADPTEVTVRFTPKADLAPGGHVVTLYAEDVVENRRTATWRFTIDTDPPEILSVRPADGRPTAEERPLLLAEVLDTGGGVDPSSISVRLDGAAVAARFDAAGGFVLARPAAMLAPGPHQVELRLADRGGETASREWEFVVDREGPALVDPTPAPDAAVREVDVLSARLSDREAGLDPESVSLFLDGEEVGRGTAGIAGYTFRPDAGFVSFMPGLPLAEGGHEVVLAARDTLGNAARHVFRFVVDRTPPSLVSLAEWRPDLPRPLVAVKVTDGASGIAGGPEIRDGGVVVPPEHVRDGGAGRFFVRPSAGGGVTVRAVDRAGNAAETTLGAGGGPPPDFEAALAAAEESWKTEKFTEAEGALRTLLAGRPGDPLAGNLLAIVLHASGRKDEAVKLLTKIVDEHPLSKAPRMNLALAHEAAGRLGMAVSQYEAYLRIDPEGEDARKVGEKLTGLRRKLAGGVE